MKNKTYIEFVSQSRVFLVLSIVWIGINLQEAITNTGAFFGRILFGFLFMLSIYWVIWKFKRK